VYVGQRTHFTPISKPFASSSSNHPPNSGGFNYGCPGASRDAPPLPQAAREEGWWVFDHERIKIGYGRKTYAQTRDLLRRWGQFQLPWATVDPGTPLAPGAPVCVAANVFGLWTAVPLQLL
jgi:hypothetical protein